MANAPSQKVLAKKPASTAPVKSEAPAATAKTSVTKPATPAPTVANPVPSEKVEAKPAVNANAVAKVKAVATAKPAVKATAVVKAKPAVAKAPVTVAVKSAPIAAPVAVVAREKVKKEKLVRDSFTMPEIEYAALGEVKKACLKAGFEVKKSELLRLGVLLVRNMDLGALSTAIDTLAPLKPGRPKKDK